MKLRSALLIVLAAAAVPLFADPDIHDTRLLSDPAVSAKQIAFIYAGDLWTCDLDGKNARRLTSDPGAESRPAFSPDGKWIAFSAQYEGNTDVYVVSSEGGVPRRLTWHPGPDEVQGFTPDGKSVLFTSPRAVYTGRYTQLYSVPVEGGTEQQLPIPHADSAVYSPDGKRFVYDQNLRGRGNGRCKREPDLHAARVSLQGLVNEFSDLREPFDLGQQLFGFAF